MGKETEAESDSESVVRDKLLTAIGDAVDQPPPGHHYTPAELLSLAQAFALLTRRSGRSGPGGPWAQAWKLAAEKGVSAPER